MNNKKTRSITCVDGRKIRSRRELVQAKREMSSEYRRNKAAMPLALEVEGSWQPKVISGEEESWNNRVKTTKSLCVEYFFTIGCESCEVFPVIEKLAAEYEECIKFARVDIDESLTIAERNVVDEIPKMSIFRNAQMYEQITGSENIEVGCRQLIARNA